MKFFKRLLSIFLVMQCIASCSLMGHAAEVATAAPCTEFGGGRNNVVDKDVINIAMASDNNYTYPLIVAMTSIIENKNPNTKIDFYIMLSDDFHNENKAKIMSLQKKYSNCHINLIDMKDRLKNAYVSGHIKAATYYRLCLASLVPNLDKILYLDSDLLVLKDLSTLYKYSLDNYYLAGVLNANSVGNINWRLKNLHKDYFAQKYGIDKLKNQYINAGITLFNLKKIRNDCLEPKFIENAIKHNHLTHDQDVLNLICYGNILIVPDLYNKAPWHNLPYEQVIIHYLAPQKPWNNIKSSRANLWWQYAEKTDYFKEIQDKYLPNSKPAIKAPIKTPSPKRNSASKRSIPAPTKTATQVPKNKTAPKKTITKLAKAQTRAQRTKPAPKRLVQKRSARRATRH